MPYISVLLRCSSWISILLALIGTSTATAQYSWQSEMRDSIEAALDGHESGGTWSAFVVNMETNEVVVDYRGQATMIPASTVKVFTSAAALDLLGPEFKYETVLTTTGPIRDGSVEGELVLHGSGDPSFGRHSSTSSILADWAEGLERMGIQRVEGNIIGDDTRFDAPGLGSGWSWDDASYRYAAQSSALSYHGNVVDIRVDAPVRAPHPRVQWSPGNTSYITINQDLERGASGSGLSRNFERLPGENIIRISGTIPTGQTTRFSVTVENPTLFTAYVFSETLSRAGISVNGYATSMRTLDAPPAPQDTLASVYSPRLVDLVRRMNTQSDNLYAEQILHTLGAEAHGDSLDVDGSVSRGLHLVRDLIQRAGADPGTVRLVDGSGLSRYNLVSAEVLVRVLAYMRTHPDPEVQRAFVRSLPVGGRDGTLQYRFRRATSARGNVRAKTGTLSNNSGLAGYVTSFEGTPFAFALIANNHVGSTRPLRTLQDQIVNMLAQYPR